MAVVVLIGAFAPHLVAGSTAVLPVRFGGRRLDA
jgi:hypothetical protein